MSVLNACPLCQGTELTVFLQRSGVPAHQNLALKSPHAARTVSRGDLDMVACARCGFGFNRAFDLSYLDYGGDYDNSQGYSPAFRAYMDELVSYLAEEQGVQNCRIVEVGCGKGTFLRSLVAPEAWHNTGVGFDTSYEGPESDLDGRLRFARTFYGPDSANTPADVVICRHVIEHVPDPVRLLTMVRQALQDAPHARVFFETPDVEWIFRNRVIWDFFYEHCSLFTGASLTTAFETAGFVVRDVRRIFGGQYLWLEAVPAPQKPTVSLAPADVTAQAAHYAESEIELREAWADTIQHASERGRVCLWGAGAKGVTFANLVDPNCRQVACVVDMNPNKQGKFLPGTGHPIVAPDQLPHYDVTQAVLMNPNYESEIRATLEALNLPLTLIVAPGL